MKKDSLLPYDQVMPGPEEAPPEAGLEPQRAYSTDDPNLENEVAGAIVSDSVGGGICNACAHFAQPDQCSGFSAPLTVNAAMVAKCTAFRPTLGAEDQADGFGTEGF